jgi:hypothetical protein
MPTEIFPKKGHRNNVLGGIIALLGSIALLVQPPLLSSAIAQQAPVTSTDPQLIMTWQTDSYASPGFRGKKLPAVSGTIVAGVSLLDNGKIVSLKDTLVQWHMNNAFLSGDIGMSKVVITAPRISPNIIEIRATIPDYKGQELLKTIEIPLGSPEVTIEAPFPLGRISTSTVTLKAHPFFFNIKNASQLSFRWSVNGESPSSKENPDELKLSIPQNASHGSLFSTTISVRNPATYNESALTTVNLSW